MEDALARSRIWYCFTRSIVLILVLMEDALALYEIFYTLYCFRLNPCFNGRCTRTAILKEINRLIPSRLNPCFNGRCTRTVSSLPKGLIIESLNPCFNGRCTRTHITIFNNPQFGEVLILVLMEDALAQERNALTNKLAKVLILVLMEDALALGEIIADYLTSVGLNPCFNGRCTRTAKLG